MAEPGPSSLKKRKSYSVQDKLDIIEVAEFASNHAAAKEYGIDRAMIIRWRKKKNELLELKNTASMSATRMRLSGGGAKLKAPELNEKLLQWVQEKRGENLRITRTAIMTQAKKLAEQGRHNGAVIDCKFSTWWLRGFLKRNNLVLRKPTSIAQKDPKELQDALINYIVWLESQRAEHGYKLIYASDETAVHLNPQSNTIDVRGAKDVTVRTFGSEKLCITVMLTARDDGYKCRPLVILPFTRPKVDIDKKFGKELHLVWAGRGVKWMNNESTEKYLRTTFGSTRYSKEKALLVWDSYRCHHSKDTKVVLRELGLHTAVIPGGCTKYLQAPDLSWNAPFKARISTMYNDWVLHGDHQLTAAGNHKAPPMEVYLQWVTEAWNSLSKVIIVESFKHCAITTDLDGSDDHLIHCLKPDSGIGWTDGIEKLRLARENRDNVEQPVDAIDLVEDLLNTNMDAAEVEPAEEVPEAQRYEAGLEEERDEEEDDECTYKPDCRCFLCQE